MSGVYRDRLVFQAINIKILALQAGNFEIRIDRLILCRSNRGWGEFGMNKRRLTQIGAALLSNANLQGFFSGTIYKGKLKNVCVPGLNCYSCPGAVGACPIGAMQSVIGTAGFNFSFYVTGFIALIGVVFGRFICGWVCPFGLIQDLLYKLPGKKIKLKNAVDHVLKYLKYLILIFFVILLPMILLNQFGIGAPYFCQYICPAGTLEGGIPLILLNKSLRSTIGFLFAWKMTLLVLTIGAAVIIYRPFCRYICPLGALYSLFNRISFLGYAVDQDKCIACKGCAGRCKMNIEIYNNPNSSECIRCGDCIRACPQQAIKIKLM